MSTQAWTGPAIREMTASDFAAHVGRVWQELESGAVVVVRDAKTGAVRGFVSREPPEALRGAADLMPSLPLRNGNGSNGHGAVSA